MNRKSVPALVAVLALMFLLFLATPEPAYAAACVSTGSGNWNTAATWDCGHVPLAGDDVTISSGHTVTIDADAVATNVTVSGTLIFDSTSRNVAFTGDITIGAAGEFKTQASGAATHTLALSGNVTNSGTFDMSRGGTQFVANVTFQKDGSQTISGSGATTRFNNITLNMGSSNANVLDIQSVITMKSGGLTLTNGTFKLSSASSITPFSGAETVGTTAGLWNNGGTINGSAGTLTLNGAFRQSAGTTTVGTGSGHSLLVEGASASVQVEGGTLNISGRWQEKSGASATITGGTVNVSTAGQTNSSTMATFQVPDGSNFSMSGGEVVLYNANANASSYGDLRITNADAAITGGVITLGQGDSTAGNMRVQCTASLANLTLNAGSTSPTLYSSISLVGDLTITSGTLAAGSNTISIAGNWTNNASFTAGTSSVTFNGSSAQSIGGTAATTFNNLTISNSSGVTLSTNAAVSGVLALTSGDLSTGSNSLTLGSAATSSGSGDVVGTVTRSHTFTADTAYAFGNPYVTIAFTSAGTHPSVVAVALTKSAPAELTTAVQRYYTVTPTGGSGYSATLRLHYATDELNGLTESDLQLWRHDGSRWTLQPKTASSTSENWLERSGVTEFSNWAMASSGEGAPTGITLARFSASAAPPGIGWGALVLAAPLGFVVASVVARRRGRRSPTARRR